MAEANTSHLVTVEHGYKVEDVVREINNILRKGQREGTANVLNEESILVTAPVEAALYAFVNVAGIDTWEQYQPPSSKRAYEPSPTM